MTAIKRPAWKIPDGIGRGRRTRTLNKRFKNGIDMRVLVMLVPYSVPYEAVVDFLRSSSGEGI